MTRAFNSSLYLVTDTRLCGARGVVETVRQAVQGGGVTLVQLREPLVSTRALIEKARALKALLRPLNIPLIINDRVDVVLAAGADGVHLGQDDMTPRDARALLGAEAIIGLSVGSLTELSASADELPFVDYLGTGPVRATATKGDAGAAIGVEGFRAVCEATKLPVVAIGGLRAEDAAPLIKAGASGLAVVSAICGADEPEQAARGFVEAIKMARG